MTNLGAVTTRSDSRRLPRTLHPVAWWLWAIGLATAASRTTNPLLLVLVLAVLGFVIANRRTEAPWARAFKYYLGLALVVVVIRVVFRVDLRQRRHQHRPHPVHAARTCRRRPGMPASSSAARSRWRPSCPRPSTDCGWAPCCAASARRTRWPTRSGRCGCCPARCTSSGSRSSSRSASRRSWSRASSASCAPGGCARAAARGIRALRSIAIPVLEDALERSLRLAAAWTPAGYGRTGNATVATGESPLR